MFPSHDLSGPIEFCDNGGENWRRQITPILQSMGVVVLDPTKMSNDIDEESRQKLFKKYRSEKNYEALYKLSDNMRKFDLRLVDVSDFIIALVDQNIPMCGTWEELATAVDQRKPILLVWIGSKDQDGNFKSGIEAMSSWGFAQFKCFQNNGKYVIDQSVFSNFDDLTDKLSQINNGKCEVDTRWVIFRPGS